MASTRSRENGAGRGVALDAPSIDGVVPETHVTPRSAPELAELLATARHERKSVAPIGGGTALGLGNIPTSLDWAVSTRALNRVLEYEPDDLTISVEAGVTIQELSDTLAERGQTLPIETAGPSRATVGGLFASGMYGARRTGSGTLRDYVIGISAAYPDGAHGKAGGMVVKNVSGFDLMRMHNGALGTLGVVTSANFKVVPKARSERTLIMEIGSVKAYSDLREAGFARLNGLVSMELERHEDGWKLSTRLEGRPSTVASAASTAEKLVGPPTESLSDEESSEYWVEFNALFDASGTHDITWIRIREQPRNVAAALESVESDSNKLGVNPAWISSSPVLGTVDVQIASNPAGTDRIVSMIGSLREAHSGTFVVTAPAAVKKRLDVWSESAESIELMRRLKQEFDPDRVLNPGRYADHM